MARLLAGEGYHTRAIGRNTWLKPEFGLAQGFDVYDHGPADETPSRQHRRLLLERLAGSSQVFHGDASAEASGEVARKACSFLYDHAAGTPFFLWLHLNNVHAPYEPKGVDLPSVGDYDGPFRFTSGTVVRLRVGNRLTASDKTRLRELYRGEVRHVDRLVGKVLAALREAHLSNSTVVVLTSDHGEEFWDHGSVMHGHTLFSELLDVPLIFSWPDRIAPRQRIDTACSLIDIMPTVHDLLGVQHDMSLPGRNLFEKQTMGERARFAEGLEFFEEQKSVTWQGWKLITSPETNKSQLYCLTDDPKESYNLVRERPNIAAELTDTLASHLERCRWHADRLHLDRSASTIRLTPKLKEQLRAQGYIE
jgi:arylsulfatase A-like enzyme